MTKPSSKRIDTDRHLRWVALGLIRVSDLAQRECNRHRVDYLVANLNVEVIHNPEVNHRHHDDCTHWTDGCPVWVMDGQHRVAALKEWLGEGWESQKLQCWVTEGKTLEEEAETYLELNNTLPGTAFRKFQIALVAGRPVECDIDRQVRHEGLVLSRDKVDGAVSAVGTLRKVYLRSDAATLGRALRIPYQAYGAPGLQAQVIDGVGHLVQRYNGELSDEAAIAALSAAGGNALGALLNRAEQLHLSTRNAKPQCVAAAAVELINRRRRGGKLPSWWAAE